MIRIMLLLLGREIIQRHWKPLLAMGLIWFVAGLSVVIDALDGKTVIPSHAFGYFLLPEALVCLLAVFGSRGTARQMRLVQAVALLSLALLILSATPASNFILAMVFGLCFLVDGSVRIGSAYVVRYPNWKLGMAGGIAEVFLAIATLQPWPTWYEGTVGCNVGAVMMLSSIGIIHIAIRIRKLEAGAPISTLFSSSTFLFVLDHDYPADEVERGDVIVHVWTPTGLANTPLRQRAINRYIAAVDHNGAISTGHAALEMQPNVYISHYPAVEIDRSPEDFGRILRATADNNVPGRFQPSYAEEAADWCESTVKVTIKNADIKKMTAFWEHYSKDNTYNLTNRNCSSSVARALDAAFEGVFRDRRWPILSILGAISYPELWAAGLMRQRAETMAWTPGLVLDYARALSAVIDPPDMTWRRLVYRRQYSKAPDS